MQTSKSSFSLRFSPSMNQLRKFWLKTSYKQECGLAQKLFYLGFGMTALASLTFIIRYLVTHRKFGEVPGDFSNKMRTGNSSLSNTTDEIISSNSNWRIGDADSLGGLEIAALLVSALGLLVIAVVFLYGIYFMRRKESLVEESMLLSNTSEVDSCEGDTYTLKTPAVSVSSSAYTVHDFQSQQSDSKLHKFNQQRSYRNQATDDSDSDEESDVNYERICDCGASGRLSQSEDDEDSLFNDYNSSNLLHQSSADLIRSTLHAQVPSKRKCTCGQIPSVSGNFQTKSRAQDKPTVAFMPRSKTFPARRYKSLQEPMIQQLQVDEVAVDAIDSL